MKKVLRCGLLTMALMGSACGMAWMGNVSPVEAFMYGLYSGNDGRYPMRMADGINLCYTHMDSGVYIDETSAYMEAHDGSKYTLTANVINWNQYNGGQSTRTVTYMYDTSKHQMYWVNRDNGQISAFRPRSDHSSEADKRGASQAMQIWHAVMGSDWHW